MKSEGPLVSVVIPCYNHEQFVQDSIQSVIDQTYKNIEVLLINDGSTDKTKEDYFIYTVFNDLYTAIKENKPW